MHFKTSREIEFQLFRFFSHLSGFFANASSGEKASDIRFFDEAKKKLLNILTEKGGKGGGEAGPEGRGLNVNSNSCYEL